MGETSYATKKIIIDEKETPPDPEGQTPDKSLEYRQVEHAAKVKLKKALEDKPSINGGRVT